MMKPRAPCGADSLASVYLDALAFLGQLSFALRSAGSLTACLLCKQAWNPLLEQASAIWQATPPDECFNLDASCSSSAQY